MYAQCIAHYCYPGTTYYHINTIMRKHTVWHISYIVEIGTQLKRKKKCSLQLQGHCFCGLGECVQYVDMVLKRIRS